MSPDPACAARAPDAATAQGGAQPRLSAAIITKNEAHRIQRCIDSVSFADEVVVVDSGSTDGTPGIAARLGARVLRTDDWPGYGPQKNRALAACRGQWVFSIDADERVTPKLRDDILSAIERPRADGYEVLRVSTFCGREIRHGDWRDDRVLRLFRREAARFSDDLVHERVLIAGRPGRLNGVLLHDSVEDLADGYAKMTRYARLGAERLRARGRGGIVSACLHAGWTFVRGYLVRLGFLDGPAGLRIAWLNARGTFLRYRLAAVPARPTERGVDRRQLDD